MSKRASDFCEDEVFLKISPMLATKIGLNEAIVLQQIHYWLSPEHNKNDRDGHYWVYNTLKQWHSQFPFWSINTIKKTLGSLENMGLILREKLNSNKFVRILWYTIDYEKLAQLKNASIEELKISSSKSQKCTHRRDQNELIEEPKIGSSKSSICNNRANSSSNPRGCRKVQNTLIEEIKTGSSKSQKCTHRRDQNELIEEPKLSSSYIEAKNTTENTTKNTLSPTSLSKFEAEPKSQNEREKKIKTQEMVDIFSKTVLGGHNLKLTPQRTDQLWQVLTEQLDSKIENWQALCHNITRSKFLMGETEKSNFKASLDWVLQAHNATKILEENYGVGDRDVPVKRDLKTITDSIEVQSEPEIMKNLRYWLLRSYGVADYASWFEQVEFVSFVEDKLVLQTPSRFVKEWLETNYRFDIRDYLTKEYQKSIQVEFVAVAKQETLKAQRTEREHSSSSPFPNVPPSSQRTEGKLREIIKEATSYLTRINPKTTRKEQ